MALLHKSSVALCAAKRVIRMILIRDRSTSSAHMHSKCRACFVYRNNKTSTINKTRKFMHPYTCITCTVNVKENRVK